MENFIHETGPDAARRLHREKIDRVARLPEIVAAEAAAQKEFDDAVSAAKVTAEANAVAHAKVDTCHFALVKAKDLTRVTRIDKEFVAGGVNRPIGG